MLSTTVSYRSDHLLLQLGIHARRQLIGPPHLDPALVDRPAIEVLCFAADHGAEGGIVQRGQFDGPVKRQLLLGLAKALPVFALIVHDAAQVPFHIQPAGLQLLLQHHQFDKALDDFEHLRQIV